MPIICGLIVASRDGPTDISATFHLVLMVRWAFNSVDTDGDYDIHDSHVSAYTELWGITTSSLILIISLLLSDFRAKS